MRALYRGLLRLYPRNYFREYAAEMTFVFTQAEETAQKAGLRVRAAFCCREIAGVLTGALRERFRFETPNSFRRFDMRKEFRFPRSTVVLMTLIFAALVHAINNGRVISMQHSAYAPTST